MIRPERVADNLNSALHKLFADDQALYLLGEDIADPSAIALACREKPEVSPLLLSAEREGWPRIVHDSGLLDQIPAVPVEHYPIRFDDHLSPTEAREWITTTPLTR